MGDGDSGGGRVGISGSGVGVRDDEPAGLMGAGDGVHGGVRQFVDPALPQQSGIGGVRGGPLLCGDGVLPDVDILGPGAERAAAGDCLQRGDPYLSGGADAVPAEEAVGVGGAGGIAASAFLGDG